MPITYDIAKVTVVARNLIVQLTDFFVTVEAPSGHLVEVPCLILTKILQSPLQAPMPTFDILHTHYFNIHQAPILYQDKYLHNIVTLKIVSVSLKYFLHWKKLVIHRTTLRNEENRVCLISRKLTFLWRKEPHKW